MSPPSESESSETIAPGTLLLGKLRVMRLLGAGGMGAVYEVEHEITKHRRALKLLHAEYAAYPEIIERFLREASAAGHIGSEHIVETFDAGHLETGEPYIVMEMLTGESLAERLAREGTMSFEEGLEVLIQTSRGVGAAHEAGIVHRDLKPENVFLVAGERPFVKLLDFGISKFDPALTGAGEGLTQAGSTLGTPFYMSPEQIRGSVGEIDARTDIYALGVVLYECLTGQKPFQADTMMLLSVLIHEGEYTDPQLVRPDMPDIVAAVIRRAMRTKTADRFPTIAHFIEALELARDEGLFHGLSRTVETDSLALGEATTQLGDVAVPRGVAGTSEWPRLEEGSDAPGSGRDEFVPDSSVGLEAKKTRKRVVALSVVAGLTLVGGVLAWVIGTRTSDVDVDVEVVNEVTAGERPEEGDAVTPPAMSPSGSATPRPELPPRPELVPIRKPARAASTVPSPPDSVAAPATPRARIPGGGDGSAPPATPAQQHGLVEENPF